MFLRKGGKPRVADFVHGSDGMGEIFLPPPKLRKSEKSASEFLVDMVSAHPGEISILALGPLTNLALVSFIILSVNQDLPGDSYLISNMMMITGNKKG